MQLRRGSNSVSKQTQTTTKVNTKQSFRPFAMLRIREHINEIKKFIQRKEIRKNKKKKI
jgi:hypothetical protein